MLLAIEGAYDLVVAEEILTEVRTRASTKRHLRDRINQEAIKEFEELIWSFAEVLSPLSGTMPSITRDRNDDFLLAAAILGDVDVLVTGDQDLLVLRGEMTRPAMMTPAEFLQLLEEIERR